MGIDRGLIEEARDIKETIRKIERTEEEICDIVRTHLKEFPLFDESHSVLAHKISDDKFWIGFRSANHRIPDGTTHFDINIEKSSCYLLYIEVVESERGKGHGKKLYHIIEDFAKALGCQNVQLTPSGWTSSGRTRKEYMLSLGYRDKGDTVEKIL